MFIVTSIGKGSVDRYVGEFGLGERNDSGDRLLEWLMGMSRRILWITGYLGIIVFLG